MKHILRILLPLLLASCTIHNPGEPGNLVPPTVDDDPSLPAVEVNATRLYVETSGEPTMPMIVFLHGGPGLDCRYLARLSGLQDSFFLVFWDQRGTGLSRRHSAEEITVDNYIEDLNQLIGHFRTSDSQQVTLVGHSWGGMYAAAFMARHPEVIARAILLACGPLTSGTWPIPYPPLSDPRLNRVLWNSDFMTGGSHEEIDYMFKLTLHELAPVEYHVDASDPSPSDRAGGVCNKVLLADDRGYLDFDFTTGLSSLEQPILFLSGQRDEILGPEFQSRQIHYFSNATHVVVDGAGHDIGWVKSDTVMSEIRRFIRR